MDTWRYFWAKTDRSNNYERRGRDWVHPLWAHLLDVATAAEFLVDRLPQTLRDRLAARLGSSWKEIEPLLTLIIGLHDVGKAIPSFQSQHKETRTKLREAGLTLDDAYPNQQDRQHHGHASIPILHRWLDRAPVADQARPLLKVLAAAAGFHHGRINQRNEWDNLLALGGENWIEVQLQLLDTVSEAWLSAHSGWPDLSRAVPSRRGWPFPPEMLAFAGWTTLADWIGSMDRYIPIDARRCDDLVSYLPISRKAICAALADAGLQHGAALQVASSEEDFTIRFSEVFASGKDLTPHPLQQIAATISLPSNEVPALAIIEAPTGEGKTEAAFYLAARLQARRADGHGVYVALPTQATSNGLFPRFISFLDAAHETDEAGSPANVLLVHGASSLNLDLESLLLPIDEDEGARSSAYAARWFLPTKRSLLAPYGVGTVDQALLGAITSRHFFLRLYGLAGKTIIFDEVHAYDGYMAALFTRLLEWLRALDADVVILSATLPKQMRRQFLKAWGAQDVPAPDCYPAVTVVGSPDPTSDSLHAFIGDFSTSQQAEVEVQFADSIPTQVAELASSAVQAGATVGVILNRVDRAQEVFELLRACELDADLYLLHARFPFVDRAERERQIIQRFGKKGRAEATRPAILVATQVAEQSLDLDVDVMLSDLAPIDLLLQRAGRLHRHALKRPPGFEHPRLYVLRPPLEAPDALPDVRSIGGQFRSDDPDGVYLNLPLFRTDLVLRNRNGWKLPRDYRPLIEAVYGDDAEVMPETVRAEDEPLWREAVKAKRELEHQQMAVADLARIHAPEDLKHLFADAQSAHRTEYDEDDDTPARDLKPQTRLGGPSAQVVCLHRRGGELFLRPEEDVRLPEGTKLEPGELRTILRYSVRLNSRRLVRALPSDSTLQPREAVHWKRLVDSNAALAFHHPLVFENGRCAIGNIIIELNPELGIRFNANAV